MGSEGIAPSFLNLLLDGGEWSALCPRCFTTGGYIFQKFVMLEY
jgi:hypothetical protein